jgi:chitin disaccharide deacetylase
MRVGRDYGPGYGQAMMIINADDFGRSLEVTDLTMQCFRIGRISSATAMVFMDDSERASRLANDAALPTGLHLNLTEQFSGSCLPKGLAEAQLAVSRFLRRSRFSSLMPNPSLCEKFRRLVSAQVCEFERIYGRAPTHIDGHHHQHLCANVLLQGLIPGGTRLRPSFHFWPGEKSALNRAYRAALNAWLSRRYRTPRFFFALAECGARSRLERVFDLASTTSVEMMIHAADPQDYTLLTSEALGNLLALVKVGTYEDL